MSLEDKLKEIFGLFEYVDFKGIPLNGSPCLPRTNELFEEILFSYGLPLAHGYEDIFIEMVRHPDWEDFVYQEAIANLERSQLEFRLGQTQFKSILVIPKSSLKSGAVVYISTELTFKYTNFMNRLSNVLLGNGVLYQFLDSTNDIWCRDYMPIKVSDDMFVQFVYDPDYLKGKWSYKKTDSWKVTESLDFFPLKSELVMDGGNVIKFGKTVIMTEKIFPENPKWSKPMLIKEISRELEVDKVVIIPIESEDYTGHSDGMVRFVGENAVIINDYLSKDGYTREFIDALRLSLESNGIKIIGTLPYRSFQRKNKDGDYTAIGCFMNYLELDELIIFPKFEIEEDNEAFEKIQQYFPSKRVVQLDCREIAEEGGVLNCITWNI
jgi:agmatine deiminase